MKPREAPPMSSFSGGTSFMRRGINKRRIARRAFGIVGTIIHPATYLVEVIGNHPGNLSSIQHLCFYGKNKL